MIGTDEAASALASIDTSRRYAIVLRGYAEAGDTLIAWGIVWLVGNAVAQFAPTAAGTVWPVGVTLAALFSMWRGRVKQRGGARHRDPRIIASIGIVIAFAVATLAITSANPHAANATISLLVAASYAVTGIWAGARFLTLGAILAIAVLVGWFVVPAWFFLCLAIGGGGTLIAGGWWLRTA